MMTIPPRAFGSRFNAARSASRYMIAQGFAKTPTEGQDFQTYKTDEGKWAFRLLDRTTKAPCAADLAADADEASVPVNEPAKLGAAVSAAGKRARLKLVVPPTADQTPTPGVAPKKKPGRPKLAPKAELPRRARAEEAAQAGFMPTPPDFSAPSHARYREKLAALVALAAKGDVEGLKAFPINPYSSSPQAMNRYRNLAVIAIEARGGKAKKLMTDMSQIEWEANQIDKAHAWTATKFLGRGKYDTHEFASFTAAKAKAMELGQGAMVYAINPEGRSVLVGGNKAGEFELTPAAAKTPTLA